jgi:hypothetical protein
LIARLEIGNFRDEPIRDTGDGLGGGGCFLDERRVLLRHAVHLRHRAVYLLDARRLFLGGGRNLGDDVRHLLHALHDLRQRLAGFIDQLGTRLHFLDRVLN